MLNKLTPIYKDWQEYREYGLGKNRMDISVKRCKKCNREIKNSFYGYGIICWSKLSKTRRFWIKWFG